MQAIAIALTLSYVALLLYYARAWRLRSATTTAPEQYIPVSIIIPMRNEAVNIATCLEAILQQDYPEALLEIIVVDDHSDDESVPIVAQYTQRWPKRIHLIQLSATQQGKKMALQQALQQASGRLIMSTDADCWAGPNWVKSTVAYHLQTGKQVLAGPVAFQHDGSFLQQFQALEFSGLMAITAAAYHYKRFQMANGANLAFTPEVYKQFDAYQQHAHIPSGDDMFLVQYIGKALPDCLGFNASQAATVHTQAETSWAAFMRQRIRWASKSALYPDHLTTAMLALTYLVMLGLWFASIVALIWPSAWNISIALGLWVLKGLADYILLAPPARWFGHQALLRPLVFIPSVGGHSLYLILAGTLSQLPIRFAWKGRKLYKQMPRTPLAETKKPVG